MEELLHFQKKGVEEMVVHLALPEPLLITTLAAVEVVLASLLVMVVLVAQVL